MKPYVFLLSCLPLTLLFYVSSISASTGKYALLLHGGHHDQGQDALPNDELFVQYEIAPMYKTLIEDYDYDDEDIWVLNLDGSYYGSYKEHLIRMMILVK